MLVILVPHKIGAWKKPGNNVPVPPLIPLNALPRLKKKANSTALRIAKCPREIRPSSRFSNLIKSNFPSLSKRQK